MATPIEARQKALAQLTQSVSGYHADALLALPKRALAAALVELMATNNGGSCDDYKLTGQKAVELATRFK